jgi:hypothetical protein
MLSSSEFANMPAVNGACAYRSLGQSLLQLFPAPRAKKYLIGAEIKQLPYLYPDTAEPDAQTAALLPRVGIYIGCNSRATEKGHRTYSVLTLCYNDFLIEEHVKQGYDKAGVAVERDVIHQWLNGRITEAIRGMGHLPYKPGPGGVSPWRWLGAEVTPDGVTLLWRETPDAPTRTVASLPVGEILRHDSELQDRIAKHPAIRGDQVGSWHPQLPLGIYCRNATVAVRNVTLKPVPE